MIPGTLFYVNRNMKKPSEEVNEDTQVMKSEVSKQASCILAFVFNIAKAPVVVSMTHFIHRPPASVNSECNPTCRCVIIYMTIEETPTFLFNCDDPPEV